MSKTPAMRVSEITVEELLDNLSDAKRDEALTLIEIMQGVVAPHEPKVWAGKIIGFGEYEYRYESGHSGHAPIAAFAPTPKHHTVYLVSGFHERYPRLIERLTKDPDIRVGKPRFSKACLYLPRLDNIDLEILTKLITRSAAVARG